MLNAQMEASSIGAPRAPTPGVAWSIRVRQCRDVPRARTGHQVQVSSIYFIDRRSAYSSLVDSDSELPGSGLPSTAPTTIYSTATVAPSTTATTSLSTRSSTASAINQAQSAGTPTSPAGGATQTPIEGHKAPTAAIVGGVLGGVIFILMVLGLFLCMRRRRRTKVYTAAVYPSPHVGSDMSPQLPSTYNCMLR